MSQSIHMLSIQIDTKNLELVNYIKLSFFASHMKSSFSVIRYSRVNVLLLDWTFVKPYGNFRRLSVSSLASKNSLKKPFLRGEVMSI